MTELRGPSARRKTSGRLQLSSGNQNSVTTSAELDPLGVKASGHKGTLRLLTNCRKEARFEGNSAGGERMDSSSAADRL